MVELSQVQEHMEIIGADGVHVGTVDRVVGDRIKLTKHDTPLGAVEGEEGVPQPGHRFIAKGLIADIEGDQVRLSANADVAVTFEESE